MAKKAANAIKVFVQNFASNRANIKFWWLQHDYKTYKVPYAGGEIVLPNAYLRPNFRFDPKLHWYKFGTNREDPRKTGDFSAFLGAALFINEASEAIFRDLLLSCCRIFPILCNRKPYYIVVVDSMHDPIDVQRSEFLMLRNYAGPIEGGISKINKIVLNSEFSTEDDIFRINHGPALNLQIIVSDRFKIRYEQSGSTGLFFKKVMPAE